MRRIIAERMAASKFAAPHYYVTVEIDMSKAKALRAKLPFKVSYNDLVLYAAVRAIREFPAVNVQWAGDALLQMPDVNLGVAVALPTGLIVPVIKQAHTLSLEGMAAAAKSLATKAQNNKLLPDDYTGNTFTVSNLGAYGVDHFTAIINQPDSAILAVGQMKDRPVVVDGGIHIRPIMKITMSSDHRLVDGAIAAQFMGKLKEILESADF
jgi:pyruvate dehydrogenase E2 component (dihydrolipoamide acetyltransferase)